MHKRRSGHSERQAPATAPILVRVDRVSKTYRNGTGETRVLHDASLELASAETTSLVGVSGSGKSTLISILAGLMLPDSGQVSFDGHEITSLDDASRAGLRARRIGVVLQSRNLIPFLTATENVEIAIKLAGGRQASARARELLAEVGLADRMDHLPRRLSGGESQRAAVAVALANEPELLLADEVTGELDSANAERVMSVIFDVRRARGLTVLFVTHSTELAGLAQRRLRLTDGEVRPA
jgi:putative ABC transport system ATP-binding protein